MSAATLYGPSLTAAQEKFEAALPTMTEIISYHFRHWPARSRDEMIADACAALCAAWHSLVRRGKDPLQVGVRGIAARCCMYTKAGRRIGNQNFGRGCPDIQDPRVRRKTGLHVVSIEDAAAPAAGAWREWLLDPRSGPADAACFSVDFEAWLAGLPERKRMMAELLLLGHETGVVARMVGISQGRVSQIRLELETRGRQYQSQAGPADITPARRPRGRPAGSSQGAQRRPRPRAAEPVLEQFS